LTITTYIPHEFVADASTTFNLKGVSLDYACKLCALILYKSSTNAVYFDQQIPLSKTYFQKGFSDHFLKKLRKELRCVKGEIHQQNKLFEVNDTFTRTTKTKIGIPKKYSIPQRYLISTNWKPYTLDIPDDLCLNELFPEVIDHFLKTSQEIDLDVRVNDYYKLLFTYELVRGETYQGITRFRIARTTDELNKFAQSQWTKGHYSKLLFLSERIEEIILPEKKHLNWWRKKYERLLTQDKYLLIEEDGDLVISDRNQYLTLKRDRSINLMKNKIHSLVNQDFNTIISKSNGRLTSNFTNLNSPLFRYVKLEGHHLVSFDLKASQPTILLNLILGNSLLLESLANSAYPKVKKVGKKLEALKSNDSSIKSMLEFVQNEDIYSFIADESGISRGEAKVVVLKWFFGKGTNKFDHMGGINERFPSFKEHLVKAKELFNTEEQENGLALLLQNVEAHLFIELILGELAKQDVPAITKHDSILVADTIERREQVTQIIDSIFTRIGFLGRIADPEALYLWGDDDDRFNKYDRELYYAAPQIYHETERIIEAVQRGEKPFWQHDPLPEGYSILHPNSEG